MADDEQAEQEIEQIDRIIDGTGSECNFRWEDAIGPHRCNLIAPHNGDHRCPCDETRYQYASDAEVIRRILLYMNGKDDSTIARGVRMVLRQEGRL